MSAPELFAIDVARELRTLAESQLRGSWQLPAEIVRFALRRGARALAVDCGMRRVTIRWRGAPPERELLEELAVALDSGLAGGRRQDAIARLETSGAEALLWAGALPGARLRIDGGGQAPRRLELGRSGRPRLSAGSGTGSAGETVVVWRCTGLDLARAASWTVEACRFADGEVAVNGRPAVRGFAAGMYEVRQSAPLPCRVGLTRRGEEPVLWLLRDGVVAARAAVPGLPPFEAAVELAGVVPAEAGGAELRRAAQPHVAALADRAAWMVANLGSRLETMAAPDRRRLTVFALRAAACGLRARELRALPLLETLAPGVPPLSVDRVQELARPRGGRLVAVEADEDAAELLVDRAATVRASAEIRGLLSELTGVRWQPPPRRRAGRWRRLRERTGERARQTVRRLRGLAGGRPLADFELEPAERELRERLRAAVAPRALELGEGGGGVRETASGFVLPRRHPVVAAAVRAVGGDPSWVYPVLLALELAAPPPPVLAGRWRRAVSDFLA